jgi:hypothetical protein
MNQKPDQILRDLDQCKSLILAARHQINEGANIDLNILEKKIADVCAEINSHSEKDRVVFKMPMLSLLDDMDKLFLLLKEKHAELGESIKNLAPQQRAVSAYENQMNKKPGEKK